MAMKYIEGFVRKRHGLLQTFVKFKWEWSIHYEFNVNHKYSGNAFWVKGVSTFPNREAVRKAMRKEFSEQCRPNKIRNIQIKRRLVQVDWEAYDDSFRWNRGCGRR
jgi:hypothetical protein